jgi:hypothetical protein
MSKHTPGLPEPCKLVVCDWCDGESMLGSDVCPQCFGEAVYHLPVGKVTGDHSIVPCDCPLCSAATSEGSS